MWSKIFYRLAFGVAAGIISEAAVRQRKVNVRIGADESCFFDNSSFGKKQWVSQDF